MSPITASLGTFSLNPIPGIDFGPGRARGVGEAAKTLMPAGKSAILLVADRALVDLGVAKPVLESLSATGAKVAVFDGIAGEPKEAQVEAAIAAVRSSGAGLVVALGGGSALDIGKIAARIGACGRPASDFALAANRLPTDGVPCICLPTTAGTGSEVSATNIYANAAGKKVWVWGQETKPARVILDPELTLSLPPHLTAWTGADAFAHALEACTNKWRTVGNDLYAHKAIALIAGALETAVREPSNIAARGKMLLGSAYAGIAIDNCGTAIAHTISHALAGLAPVHHGHATALGLEVALPWQVAADEGAFAAAAAAVGLGRDASGLADWYTEWLTRCGVTRKLPSAFAAFTASDLAREMRAPENAPMRKATARQVTDTDIDRLAASLMALK